MSRTERASPCVGAALAIGLHILVILSLAVAFASLRQPPQQATVLTVALLPVRHAPSPRQTAPRPPTLIQPAAQAQLQQQPVIDLEEPAPSTAPSASPAPAPPTAAATQPADVKAALENWEGRVMAALQNKERYPEAATQAGQQDIITVHVILDSDGNVIHASVLTSKHFALLDEAALDLLRRCSPLPAPPTSLLAGDRIAFDLPLDYTIKTAR